MCPKGISIHTHEFADATVTPTATGPFGRCNAGAYGDRALFDPGASISSKGVPGPRMTRPAPFSGIIRLIRGRNYPIILSFGCAFSHFKKTTVHDILTAVFNIGGGPRTRPPRSRFRDNIPSASGIPVTGAINGVQAQP
jgi:hypothetical protein